MYKHAIIRLMGIKIKKMFLKPKKYWQNTCNVGKTDVSLHRTIRVQGKYSNSTLVLFDVVLLSY